MLKFKLNKFSKTILFIFLAIIFNSCSDDDDNAVSIPKQSELNTKIAVFSDAHYFSSSLGTSGSAFEEYLAVDRKLIAESQAISESLTSILKNESVSIVLVAGDLTKDGEKQSHEEFAALLKQIENTGKKVYVVPGNHDVANPEAYSYSGANKTKVANISADDFAQIYADYGFSEAIAKDANSLSYVVEPTPGLVLIAMDACRYKENDKTEVIGGKFSDATLTWIKSQITKAKSEGKTVIGMMHHGLVEHFTGQKTNPISADYVIDDWQNVATSFANLGMRAVFTGHFHANDITRFDAGTDFIYDIETGSLVTSPCAYRIINFNNNKFDIATKFIQSINYNTGGKTFTQYAADYTYDGMLSLITNQLKYGFGLDDASVATIAPIATSAFITHYKGDETIPAEYQPIIDKLINSSDMGTKFFGQMLASIFTDLNPADNNVSLILNTTKK